MQHDKNTDNSYLWDIQNACKDIIEFISGITFEEYETNKLIRYSVERQIIVIGEAANHLSEDFLIKTSHINWSAIIGLRNIVVHDYGEVLNERLWKIASKRVPKLYSDVTTIINEFVSK